MFDINYVYMFILLIVSGFLYRRFVDKYNQHDEYRQYNLIKKYLLNDSALAKSKKPILWIHVPYELNSRSWDSFYSRTNSKLNQPYQYITIQSIVNHCGKSFHQFRVGVVRGSVSELFRKLATTDIVFASVCVLPCNSNKNGIGQQTPFPASARAHRYCPVAILSLFHART